MATTAPYKGDSGLHIIHAGLMRTGTKSMATAYSILGFNTHHGMDYEITGKNWEKIERAAEATWHHVPSRTSPRPARFTRADWDDLWGEYDVVMDIASPFADQLIEAYPNAKVVIVEREFESWWRSFHELCLRPVLSPMSPLGLFVVWLVLGVRAGHAMRKVHQGFFGSNDIDEIKAHARERYKAYYDRIRAMVPQERRLDYTLEQGWGPLCAFLGVPVPDAPFPRVNDLQAHAQHLKEQKAEIGIDIARKVAPILVGMTTIAIGAWCLAN
eukprot:TRINITY_DN539_c0_g1_i1.p1 TRINITY_DN539_c0_g1~~TRINITY_DN539_c0_g1_i1.p1  ORF type:complete len:271 (+),score=55.96 TRINITY_DN539_c0_g1_i1:55-867(+)